MGIIKSFKLFTRELDAVENEHLNYQKMKLDKLNSINNNILVKNENNKMPEEELKVFLENNPITVPEGAFINKNGEIEYEHLERCIYPPKIICPDCGGITLEGLDFCDKCGGEISQN